MAFTRVPSNSITDLFATPLMRRNCPDAKAFDKRLRKIVLDRERASPDDGRGDVGGWRSASDLPGRPFDQKVRIRPRAGELILFPSWLLHYVNPYEGRDVRISVAFNISTQTLRVDEAPAAAAESAPGPNPGR